MSTEDDEHNGHPKEAVKHHDEPSLKGGKQ